MGRSRQPLRPIAPPGAKGRAAGLLVAAALFHAGCSRTPTSSPTSRPSTSLATRPGIASAPATRPVLVAEAADWSTDECLANLDDEALCISAAVQLVRLSGQACAAVPRHLDEADAVRLRVVRLDAGHYALGAADAKDPSALHAPVLIDAMGNVCEIVVRADAPPSSAPSRDVAGAAAWLRVSADGEVFPHLILAGRRIFLATATDKPAMTLRHPVDYRFGVRSGDGFDHVALVGRSDRGEDVVVARYLWDPFELRFLGPASDKLPAPLSGRFELELGESGALLPVGGEIPAPDPLQPLPETRREPS